MKKIIFAFIFFAILGVLAVMAFGAYKFNYLSGQPGYGVDGNKCQQRDAARGCGDLPQESGPRNPDS